MRARTYNVGKHKQEGIGHRTTTHNARARAPANHRHAASFSHPPVPHVASRKTRGGGAASRACRFARWGLRRIHLPVHHTHTHTRHFARIYDAEVIRSNRRARVHDIRVVMARYRGHGWWVAGVGLGGVMSGKVVNNLMCVMLLCVFECVCVL